MLLTEAGMNNMNDKYLIMYQLHHCHSKYTPDSAKLKDVWALQYHGRFHHNYSPSTRNHIKCAGLYLTNCWFFWPQFILSCFILIFCLVSFCWFLYKYSRQRSLSEMTRWRGGSSWRVYLWLSNYHTEPKEKQDSGANGPSAMRRAAVYTHHYTQTEGKYIHLSDRGRLWWSLQVAILIYFTWINVC